MSVRIGPLGVLIGPGGAIVGDCCCEEPDTGCKPGELCNCNLSGPGCIDTGAFRARLRLVNGQWTVEYWESVSCCCVGEDVVTHIRQFTEEYSGGCYRRCLAEITIDYAANTATHRRRTRWTGANCPANETVEFETEPFGLSCAVPPYFATQSQLDACGDHGGQPRQEEQGWLIRDCGYYELFRRWDDPESPNWTQLHYKAWHSNYVRCVDEPCTVGACCCAGTCHSDTSASDCSAMGGTYKGDGSRCGEAECPRGCCLADGCEDLTPTECEAQGGRPYPYGILCDEGPCGAGPTNCCTGACCEEGSPHPTCSQKTEADCAIAGGMWLGLFTECTPNPCLGELGACCHRCGGCSEVPAYGCNGWGDEWAGEGVSCDPSPCTAVGACCVDGACFQITQECCAEQGGDYLGNNTSCDPDPCAEDHGSCCHPDGSCTEGTLSDCAKAGGSYQGHGTECASTVCPLEPGPICNACCTPEGDCTGVPGPSNCPSPNTYHPGVGCPGSGCATTVACSISEGGGDSFSGFGAPPLMGGLL